MTKQELNQKIRAVCAIHLFEIPSAARELTDELWPAVKLHNAAMRKHARDRKRENARLQKDWQKWASDQLKNRRPDGKKSGKRRAAKKTAGRGMGRSAPRP